MNDKLGLVRDYLFGEPKDRQMARFALADWFEEGGLPEAPTLRSLGVSLWVWPGDWDQQECILHESVTAEDAVARCHHSFASRAELDSYAAGLHQWQGSGGNWIFHTEEECLARVRPLWSDFQDDDQLEGETADLVYYDDKDLHTEADPDDEDEDLSLGDLEDWADQSDDSGSPGTYG